MYFHIVTPTLFPSNILSKIRVIITDVCPKEFIHIDIAQEIVFGTTLRIRCGFYLVRIS